MEKKQVSITELVAMGYPRKRVEEACRGEYASFFCRRVSNKPKSKYIINLENFEKCWRRECI